MTKTYTLTVFNTCTSQYEDIEVTKEVYNEFRRGEWRIEKNDDKHRANETPFSELIGGDDGAFEIIKQGKFIKQCEHCGRWFVTEKKTDEKYCKRISPYNDKKTCAQVMRRVKESQRIKKSPLAKAKEQARNRANSRETYHPGAADEYKLLVSRWDILYKSGRISEDEYITMLNACMRSTKRGENA